MSNATMITISGNLAEAPELKLTPGGKATARMRVAVDSRRRDPAGEWVDGPTSWYTVIAWDTLAENLAETLSKGDRVLVHGRLEQREWADPEDQKHTVWEVTAEEAGPSLRMPARGGTSRTWTTATVDRTTATPAPRKPAQAATRTGPRRWARAGNN